jgi:hypothetical protein
LYSQYPRIQRPCIVRAVGDHTHEHDDNVAVKGIVVVDDIGREAETSQNSKRNSIRVAVDNIDDGVLATNFEFELSWQDIRLIREFF